MEKVEKIKPEDIKNLKANDDGTFQVPEGYVIYRIETTEDKISKLNIEIEYILALKEPNDDELNEFAKSVHPYYTELLRLEKLKQQIEGLKS